MRGSVGEWEGFVGEWESGSGEMTGTGDRESMIGEKRHLHR